MLQVDLLDMLYQKSLRLGVDVRNARGIGTVVNLQSNDASKVWMMPVHIHTLWNSPFQVPARIRPACGAPATCVTSALHMWLFGNMQYRCAVHVAI